jgi:hypothetical protein
MTYIPLRTVAIASAIAAVTPALGATQTAPNLAAIPQADRVAISATLDSVYGVISGPIGQQRDWAKMRSLFTPDARLAAISSKGVRGGGVEDYIKSSGPLLTESGFSEREFNRRIEVYGNLAHAWSSYEGVSADGKIKVRGINSFQLVRQADGSWKVFTILWQPETPTFPLPADMHAPVVR